MILSITTWRTILNTLTEFGDGTRLFRRKRKMQPSRHTVIRKENHIRPRSKQITVAMTLKHEEFRSQCTFLNAKMPPLENSTKNPITRRAHVFRPGVCSRCIFPIRKCPSLRLVHIDPEAGGGAISVCANATVFLQQNQDNNARPLWAKQKMFQRLGLTRYLHTSISVEIAISFPSVSEIYLCVFLSLSCTISLSLSPLFLLPGSC